MDRRKWRNLAMVAFIGLFVLTKELVFLWFLAFALVVLRPSCKKSGQSRSRKIWQDAKDHRITIPQSHNVEALLDKVYDLHQRTVRLQPQLRSSMDEILDDLWQALALESSPEGWVVFLRKVIAEWPVPSENIHNRIQEKLRKVQEMSTNWSEAQKEAYGEKV